MILLSEQEAQRDVQCLARAWEGSDTFVFLPEKMGVDLDWVKNSLALFPESLRSGHYALLTSGTTGAPKLVIGKRERTEALAATLHTLQESEPVEETILALPLSYSYAFVNQWVWSWCHRRKLTLTPGLKFPGVLLQALQQARNAMICLVGVQVPLLSKAFQGQSFPGMIRVHFAGGRFPQENLHLVRALFPNAQVFNNYGCAEALPRLTLRKAEEAEQAAEIGRPLPGIEMAANENKEIIFRSRYGAVGVIEEGAFTAITPDMWVKSGDLGEPLSGGTWRLLGRASEVFKRHGEKISLATLTTTVSRAWQGQAAFYRERDRDGEEGHILIVAPPPAADQLQGIIQALRQHHPRAHWPLRIESVQALPLLPNGKPDVRGAAALPRKVVLWNQNT